MGGSPERVSQSFLFLLCVKKPHYRQLLCRKFKKKLVKEVSVTPNLGKAQWAAGDTRVELEGSIRGPLTHSAFRRLKSSEFK